MGQLESGAKVYFGTFFFGKKSPEEVDAYLEVLQKHRVRDLDTASGYKNSEKALGMVKAPARFAIHTKAPGFVEGCLKRESVLGAMRKSLEDMGVVSVETLFLHTPDRSTPLEETLEAVNELHLDGKFRRFGLSNFLPAEVEEVHATAASKGLVLPSVYEGNYNPLSRHVEESLFPLLRRLGMSFVAYSPLAGGFLVRSADEIRAGVTGGRFDRSWWLGKMYHRLYNRPRLLEALPEWHRIAEDAGCSRAALAYRWVAFNSALRGAAGDGFIIGASRPEQLAENLESVAEGPLPAGAVARIDGLWEAVRSEAPLDDFHVD